VTLRPSTLPGSPLSSRGVVPRLRPVSAGGRIGLAATTGAAAKALSLVAQIAAVAIAVRSLGPQGFALYVVIASLVSWISLAGLGVAPGLTLGIARAAGVGDEAEEARLLVAALVLMTGIALVLVACAIVLGESGIVERQMVGWLGSAASDASTALLCTVLLIAAQLVVLVPEAAQLGLQTQYVTSAWVGIGSAAAVLAMLTLGRGVTSVAAFVVISQGPQVGARAVNGILFVARRRVRLRRSDLHFRAHAWTILSSGIGFAGFQVAGYLTFQVGLLILAATAGVAAVGLGGVIARGVTLEVAVLALVTTPTWPAIANAIARGDVRWVRRAYRLLGLGGLAYASLVAAIILMGFEPLIGLWTGTRPQDDFALRGLLAVYVVVNGWAHVNAMTLVGLGALRFTAIVLVVEAVLVVALQTIFVPIAGVTAYVGALTFGAITVSGWALALRVRRELTVAPET
jgi:O-antigen/teichoic acid export membrane protein